MEGSSSSGIHRFLLYQLYVLSQLILNLHMMFAVDMKNSQAEIPTPTPEQAIYTLLTALKLAKVSQ